MNRAGFGTTAKRVVDRPHVVHDIRLFDQRHIGACLPQGVLAHADVDRLKPGVSPSDHGVRVGRDPSSRTPC